MASKPRMCVIDAGARLPLSDFFQPIAKHATYWGFEPDPDCGSEIVQSAASLGFIKPRTFPVGVSSSNGNRTLHKTANAYPPSIVPVSTAFRNRYGNSKWDSAGTATIECVRIDDIWSLSALGDLPILLKLDIQGTELDALIGCREILKRNVVAVVSEIDFIGAYSTGPTAHKIGSYLEQFDFRLFELSNINYRSRKWDRSGTLGNERIFWSDGIFFLDPFIDGFRIADFNLQMAFALGSVAVALGYNSFYFELLEIYPQLDSMIGADIFAVAPANSGEL